MSIAAVLLFAAAASAATLPVLHRTGSAAHVEGDSLRRLRGGNAAQLTPLPARADAELAAHAITAEALLAQFGVSVATGLSLAQVAELQKTYGRNELAAEEQTPLWKLLAAQFDDRLVQILLGVAALSYGLARLEGEANGWVEPAVIVMILAINAVVGVLQESSAASALDALQKLQPDNCKCLRGGEWVHDLPAAELVPGDIVEIRVGDRVPADARLVALVTKQHDEPSASRTLHTQICLTVYRSFPSANQTLWPPPTHHLLTYLPTYEELRPAAHG